MRKTNQRFLAVLLAAVLLMGLALPAAAEEVQETGSQETNETLSYTKTISIRSVRDLLKFAENCKLDTWSIGKRVVLKKDISLEGIDFDPIPTFAGRFDGKGHTISGLTLDGSLTPAGLFGEVQATGIVCDLTVSGNVIPAGDAQYVGGIVGENHGTITNCHFVGSVSGSGNVGGIAGLNGLTGRIGSCQAEGTVQGSSMAGGITGCNLGQVTDCTNKAHINTVSIDPTVDVADINFDFLTDVSKLTSLDTRSAAMDTGGIAGYSSGILTGCTNEAPIGYPHIGYNVGGIAGRSCGYVFGCTNHGKVCGRKDVGGVLGQMEPFIAKNLSESSLAQLQQQLEELDDLVGIALEDADGLSDTLTARLGAIAGSIGSAADAAGNIQTSGSISSDVTGSGESGAEGSITITPAEGGIGGDIHVGGGSISGGIGGSISGGVEGDGSSSASGSLNAQTQIEIDSNLEGLSSALSNMAGQMRILSGELGEASGALKADVEQIRSKISQITQLGFDLVLGDNEDVLIDSSDIDMDQITLGKAAECTNTGLVSGDINTGGIAGCMAMEYALDPEDDLTVNVDKSTRRKYEVKAVIYQCENTGTIQAKRNYAGGIAGKMDVGIIAQSRSFSTVSSEGGNYVGGIAGLCASTIRQCFSKCALSGENYVGGIVGSGVQQDKAGESSTVAACYAIVTITDCQQYAGAISGAYAGTFLENYFVSDTLAGINRRSYDRCAQPIPYSELLERLAATSDDEAAISTLALPEEFQKFHLEFVVDDEVIASHTFAYGDSFTEEIFPDIPQKEGCYAHWDRTTLENLRFDTTVTALYAPYISALASNAVRGDGKPVFFAEGDFGEADTLLATTLPSASGNFPVAHSFWDTIQKSLAQGKVATEVVEQWQLRLSCEEATPCTFRYLPPDGDIGHMDIYALVDGQWLPLETETIGSYVAFQTASPNTQIAIVHSIPTWWSRLALATLLLALAILIVQKLRRCVRRK